MPPRVLLVGTFLSSSLRTRSPSEELAARLRAAGWDITVTSTRRARLPRLVDYLTTVWSRRHDYDVANVDVYSGAAFVWAEAVCALLRAAGKPYMLTLHGGNLPAMIRESPGRVGRLLGAAAAVAAPSRYLIENARRLRGDIQLIPNAIELADYPFRERTSPEPKLVWLRSFHDIYNPSMAPEVLARVLVEHPGAELTMIGSDKGDGSLQRVRATIERLGVERQVRIVGGVPKEEVPSRLQLGDIFLNTTNVDNTPVSVIEAMACGLCVVSTSVGGIPYMLDDGVDALLVEPANPDAMARAVARILAEPALAASLSTAARSAAVELDWRPVLARWKDLLSTIATGKS